MADVNELIGKALDKDLSSYQRRKHIEELAQAEGSADEVHGALKQLLTDDDAYVQREAIQSIKKAGHPRAAADLAEYVASAEDADDYVRRDIIEVLGNLGDPSAKPVLEELTKSDRYTLSYAARRALETLEKAAPPPPPEPEPVTEAPEPVAVEEPAPKESEPEKEPEPAPEADEPEKPSEPEAKEEEPKPVEVKPVEPKPVEVKPIEAKPAEPKPPPPPEPKAESEPEPPPLPPAPSDLDWKRMPRLRAFFTDSWDEVRGWYAVKLQAERELVPLDQKLLDITIALERRRADKDDDIADCQKAIQEDEARIEALNNQARRKRKELDARRAEAKTFWWPFKVFFSPSTRNQHEAAIEELIEGLKEADREIDDREKALKEGCDQLEELSAPLRKLMLESKDLAAGMQEKKQVIVDMHERINERVRKIVCGTGDEELHKRLHPVSDGRRDDPFLKTCIDEIQDAALTSESLEEALKKHKEATAAHRSRCGKASDAMAAQISNGFVIHDEDRSADVRLSAVLRFTEDSSFFGGYSNAEGSAKGRGSAKARYSVEEIDWRPTEGFSESVNQFSGAWEDLGEHLAHEALAHAKCTAAKRTVSDYVDYLRSELERDLREGGR